MKSVLTAVSSAGGTRGLVTVLWEELITVLHRMKCSCESALAFSTNRGKMSFATFDCKSYQFNYFPPLTTSLWEKEDILCGNILQNYFIESRLPWKHPALISITGRRLKGMARSLESHFCLVLYQEGRPNVRHGGGGRKIFLPFTCRHTQEDKV